MSYKYPDRRQFFQRVTSAILNTLFPPRCPGCGVGGEVWCSACQSKLEPCTETGCPRCGFRHKPGQCSISKDHPLEIQSYAFYKPPLIKAILDLKYRPNHALGRVMAGWLETIYDTRGWQADLVLPVPLSVARHRQRGYNQVELISSPLAEALDLPHYRNALKRVRDTGSQVGRDLPSRRKNVEGAFSAEPRICDRKFILLIDDLATTGATIHACAQALFQAGAVKIFALTVGRASRYGLLAAQR